MANAVTTTPASGRTYYQFPPSGGLGQPIPPGGLVVDFSFRGGQPTNMTVVCTAGTATFQYWDDKDNPSQPAVIASGNGYNDINRIVQRFSLTGNATVALVLNQPPADISIANLLSIATGQVSIIGNTNSVTTQGSVTTATASTGSTPFITPIVPVPVGATVSYTLSVSGQPATAGGFVGCYLQGGTSGTIYAYCVSGSIAGQFYMPVLEILQAYWVNTDTVNHEVAATWQASTP
jgi:hypothetical protein